MCSQGLFNINIELLALKTSPSSFSNTSQLLIFILILTIIRFIPLPNQSNWSKSRVIFSWPSLHLLRSFFKQAIYFLECRNFITLVRFLHFMFRLKVLKLLIWKVGWAACWVVFKVVFDPFAWSAFEELEFLFSLTISLGMRSIKIASFSMIGWSYFASKFA